MRKQFITFYTFLKQVFVEFIGDNILKYSASLAYYTVLSIAPLLVILLTISGFLFGKESLNLQLYEEINKLVGADAAMQIQSSIQNIHLNKDNVFATTIGIIVLTIGATGIFNEIQDSLNRIWGLKIKAKKVWWKLLIDRLVSFSLILSLGFVLIVSLVLNAIAAAISDKIIALIPGIGNTFLIVLDSAITLLITTLLFGSIFKVLPDGDIKWKDVMAGAMATALLFMLGKFGISFYISKSQVGSTYGAAGSLVILLLWIYYSSLILYFGAELTKAYAVKYGSPIHPNQYAVTTKMVEVETGNQTVQTKENMIIETNQGEVTNNKN